MSARPVGRTLALPLLVATLLAVAVPGAAAGPVLPVGEAQGVRIKRERGALVVVFTREAAPLYRLVAGKVVRVICTDLRADDGIRLGVTESASGGGGVRASKRRRPLRTGDLTRGLDYCRVWLAKRTVRRRRVHRVYGERLIVSVPLTQAGAVHLDEEAKAWTCGASCSPASRRTRRGARSASAHRPSSSTPSRRSSRRSGSTRFRWRIPWTRRPPGPSATGATASGTLRA